MKQKKEKNRKRIISLILIFIVAFALVCTVYLSDYYHASEAAMKALDLPPASLEILRSDHRIDVIPPNPIAGMIFYPGGKVQYEAYVPLLEACAEKGILCIMPKMPGNLAVLDMNAADGIQGDYPQISKWYMAGHSLGGAMAANYAASHADSFSGLILLAAYSTKDLTQSGLQIISIYGSEDGVLNMDKMAQSRTNLPESAKEHIIDGGCHAFFGSYGSQDGDGAPTISRESQIRQTADLIEAFLLIA